MPTDFEQLGLVAGEVEPQGRNLLLTVDFEAFAPEHLPLWLDAMKRWAEASLSHELAFSFFVSIEHVVRLRAEEPTAYAVLLEGVRALADAGNAFHPHNHCVFDLETGIRKFERLPRGTRPPDYRKRGSMFYDVVYRNRVDLEPWLATVVAEHARFLREAEVGYPDHPAFRAGGWDHGSSRADQKRFIDALAANGFEYDSSATSGLFATRTWKVGAPFGRNVFRLTPSLVEVAACWSLDCGRATVSSHSGKAFLELLRQGRLWAPPTRSGVFTGVLHFDHLFHEREDGRQLFAVSDPTVVDERIRSTFRWLSTVRSALRLRSVTFDQLQIGDGAGAIPRVGEQHSAASAR